MPPPGSYLTEKFLRGACEQARRSDWGRLSTTTLQTLQTQERRAECAYESAVWRYDNASLQPLLKCFDHSPLQSHSANEHKLLCLTNSLQ